MLEGPDRRLRLIEYIRNSAAAPEPDLLPELPPPWADLVCSGALPGCPPGSVKAVLFDIYGTLFSSAAGEIGEGAAYSLASLDALALEYAENCTGEELKAFFRTAVLRTHGELYAQTSYPEVRVEEIWADFLRYHGRPGLGADPEELALRYELAVNPPRPMPQVKEVLQSLRDAGLVLGLVSNAQFFTPLLFDAFFNASPEELGFDPGLLIYSYQLGEAKPAPSLFIKALHRLSQLDIPPEACLHVGNDMLNDVYAAAAAGFKTLLFAGDHRSLRLRADNRVVQDVRPTGIIRGLADIPPLCGAPYSPDKDGRPR
jgi:putative hydrolase of the HAD superfamily